MGQRILIAEDDADIRSLLKLYLESEGYEILEAEDGLTALKEAQKMQPDMAILDVMMPEMDGFSMTRELRKNSDIPILILSAKSRDTDKILGLNLGADDYIAKPFNPVEIVARVKAQLRRSAKHPDSNLLVLRELRVNTANFTVQKNGQQILLTPMEFRILAQLMQSPGRIFTKMQLYECVSGEFFESDMNTMMVHISKLREKIEDDPKNPKYIITVRGLGYKIEK
jgi:DNA-binding response OmpR family regulator